MKRLLLVVALLIVSCGKNDGVRPTGPGFIPPVAPPPQFVPTGGAGGGGFPGTGGYQPQMPQGYPNRYYPFLPVDNYFRQNQQLQLYWQQLWSRWQMYAQQRQIEIYNFYRFWYEYCPQEWHGTGPGSGLPAGSEGEGGQGFDPAGMEPLGQSEEESGAEGEHFREHYHGV